MVYIRIMGKEHVKLPLNDKEYWGYRREYGDTFYIHRRDMGVTFPYSPLRTSKDDRKVRDQLVCGQERPP